MKRTPERQIVAAVDRSIRKRLGLDAVARRKPAIKQTSKRRRK
jgi:hypothetical protein